MKHRQFGKYEAENAGPCAAHTALHDPWKDHGAWYEFPLERTNRVRLSQSLVAGQQRVQSTVTGLTPLCWLTLNLTSQRGLHRLQAQIAGSNS
jgi:hypothetical protein